MPDDCPKGGYTTMPRWVTRNLPARGLTDGDLAVLMVLLSYQDEKHRCYPSERTIADHLGKSEISIYRSIKRLKEKLGLVVIRQNRRSADASQRPNIYDLSPLYRLPITGEGYSGDEPSPVIGNEADYPSLVQGNDGLPFTGETDYPSPVKAERIPEERDQLVDSLGASTVGGSPASGQAPSPFSSLPENLRAAAETLHDWPAWRQVPAQTIRRLKTDTKTFPRLDLAKCALECVGHYSGTGGKKRTGESIASGSVAWATWLAREDDKRKAGGNGKQPARVRTDDESLSGFYAGLDRLTAGGGK